MIKKPILLFWLFLSFSLITVNSFGQASLETFGHNRIQNQRFSWKFYESEHFKVYFYGRGGTNLARFVTEQVEKDIIAIEHNAGAMFPDKFSIMLFNSYDDYKQSNIGLISELQMQTNNPAGTVQLVGDKLIVYFNGNHENLRKQLRLGMAQVVMEHLIFGLTFREMARNAVLLDLPRWVTDGYADYLVDGWTAKDDNDWKNIIARDSLKAYVFQKGKLFFAKDKQLYFNKKFHFNDLASEYPRLAGKAFWKYVSEKYDASKIQELIYLIQLKGSVNKASKQTFNKKINVVFDSVIAFYQNRYKEEEHLFNTIDTTQALFKIPVTNKETEIRNVTVSPRGSDIAYVEWELGAYKVIIQRTKKVDGKVTHERSIILQGGNTDHEASSDPDYPIIAWDNTGFRLGMVHKKGKNIQIKVYNALKGNQWNYKIPQNRVDRITGFSFLQDDDEVVLSAIKNGKSDLYYLRFKAYRLTPLTDDDWDDKEPVFVSGGSRKGILFLSNRPQPYLNIQPLPNELPTGKMNAYFYNLTTKSLQLLQLTNEEQGTISCLSAYGHDNFTFLSDKNGVNNRYIVLFGRDKNNMDSAFAVPATNYNRSILHQNYNPASRKIAEAIQFENNIYTFFSPIEVPALDEVKNIIQLPVIDFIDALQAPMDIPLSKTTSLLSGTSGKEDKVVKKETKRKGGNIQIETGDVFQSNFAETNKEVIKEEETETEPADNSQEHITQTNHQNKFSTPGNIFDSQKGSLNDAVTKDEEGRTIRFVDSSYIEMRSVKYYLSFMPDFFSLRLDNNLIFNRYQPYSQNSGQYNNPSLGGMIMARLYDKMEDYRFTGGIRIPANLTGWAYFLQFENFRRRIDWSVTLYREDNKQTYNFLENSGSQNIIQLPGKTTSNIIQGHALYPFNEISGMNLFLALRQDRMIIKAKDYYGLKLPSVQDIWSSARLEYITDNTRNYEMNIWKGHRYKFFAESMYKLYSDNDVYRLSTDTAGFKKHSFIYAIGFDARFYQPIYKNFIFASRFSGAHSGGSQQIIYFLGGEANALNPKFDGGLPPSQKMDYAYQQLATDLRGYNQNARNGNSYILANLELRLPILTTFIHRPIQSTILKNLQAVAFLDIGNAWEGFLPTSSENQRAFMFDWPLNVGLPTISVGVPNPNDNGLAIGYGLGLRTMLWGYFIRIDAALNKQNQSQWYLSFGTDF